MSNSSATARSPLHLDDAVLKVIDESVKDTFQTFMDVAPTLIRSEKHDVSLSETYEISGLIGFIQNAVEGYMAIRFEKKSILFVMNRILNEEIIEIDNRVIGGVAEFTNVIHGIAKEQLNLQGYKFQMCLPVVVIGSNHRMVSGLTGDKLVLNYDLAGVPFVVELVLHDVIPTIPF